MAAKRVSSKAWMVTGSARSPWWGFSAVCGSMARWTGGRQRGAPHGGIRARGTVVSVYLLVISAALLSAGRLGDVVGRRRVFTGGMLLFTLGSGLCGFAWSLPILVAARGVQALGASA